MVLQQRFVVAGDALAGPKRLNSDLQRLLSIANDRDDGGKGIDRLISHFIKEEMQETVALRKMCSNMDICGSHGWLAMARTTMRVGIA